jgi:hypothetical protein
MIEGLERAHMERPVNGCHTQRSWRSGIAVRTGRIRWVARDSACPQFEQRLRPSRMAAKNDAEGENLMCTDVYRGDSRSIG